MPIYIRTGKAMPKRVSEVAVQFKAVPHMLFNTDTDHPLEPNVLALRIQPDEGLALRIGTKLPRLKVKIYPVKMDFRYGSTFGDQSPRPMNACYWMSWPVMRRCSCATTRSRRPGNGFSRFSMPGRQAASDGCRNIPRAVGGRSRPIGSSMPTVTRGGNSSKGSH